MNITITGAPGSVGHNLVSYLRDRDQEVTFSRGVARVNRELQANGNDDAEFNFDLMTVRLNPRYMSSVTPQVTEQVTTLIRRLDGEMDKQEIQDKLGLPHRENFRSKYLKPALEQGISEPYNVIRQIFGVVSN